MSGFASPIPPIFTYTHLSLTNLGNCLVEDVVEVARIHDVHVSTSWSHHTLPETSQASLSL